MASTYTDILRLTLPTTGELDGTWGTTVNTGITALIETALAGTANVTHDDTANYTLTTASGSADEARAMFLNVTGTLGAARNVVCPTKSKLYFIKNGTTGGFAVTLKTTGGTGISVPNGKYMALYCDGTNVVEAINAMGAITATSVNKVAITAPATSATLALVDGTTVTGPSATSTLPGLSLANSFTAAQLIQPATDVAPLTLRGHASATANLLQLQDSSSVAKFTVSPAGAISAGTIAVGGITGLGTGVATALAVAVGSAGAPVVNGGALGTPSSGTLTNATGLPAAGVTGTALVAAAIGTTVQAYDAQLADVAGLTPTDNGVIIGNGTNFVVESGATLKTSLGLTIGTDVQAYDADLTTWAGITPGTGVATALAVNVGSAGAPVVNGGALGTPSSGTVTNLTGTASININGTVGATTPAAGSFTTLSASSTITSTGTLLQATPGANSWGINVQRDSAVNRAGWKYDYATDKVYIWSAANASAPELTLYNGLAVTGALSASDAAGGGTVNVGTNVRTQYQSINFGGSVGGIDYAWQIGRSPTAGILPDGFYIYDFKSNETRVGVTSTGLAVTGALSASGNALIGGTSTPTAGRLGVVAASGGISLALSDNVNNSLYVSHAPGNVKIGCDVGAGLEICSNGFTTPAITLLATGVVSVPIGQIKFPATQNASSDANTLDDYDEYTAASAACAGAITTAAVWKLTKVGNVVTLTLPAVTGATVAVGYIEFGVKLPAKYRPIDSTQWGGCHVQDNSTAVATGGAIRVYNSGEIYIWSSPASTQFVNLGNAGLLSATSVSWTI